MVVDMSTMAIIGAGIVGGEGDVEQVTAEFDQSGMTWVFDGDDDNGLESAVGQWFKFRVAGGWKALLADQVITSSTEEFETPQLLINTNFGCPGEDFSCNSLTNLTAGGGNIETESNALNRYTLNWSPGSGFTGTIDELAAIAGPDLSDVSMSLIGTAVLIDGGEGNWDTDSNTTFPTADGDLYNYNLGSTTLRGGAGLAFKIRTTGEWAQPNFGYNDITEITGTAADLLIANGRDFGIGEEGDFPISEIIFIRNSGTGEKLLEINY